MIQQTIDSVHSKFSEGNVETNFSARDKQFAASVKKTALRDVQNENRIHNPVKISPLSTDRVQVMDASKVSSTEGAPPESTMTSPVPFYQSTSGNSASTQRYYVRRKHEAQFGTSCACDISSVGVDCLNSKQASHPVKTTQPTAPKKEPKVSCYPALEPLPVTSLTNASGKPSVPLPHTHSNMRPVPAESNCLPVACASPSSNNPKGVKKLHWEERFLQLQILLKKLDEADQEDYLQMLRSLSSVDLSKLAVELEKRAIQLSLEEAKEVQRVGVLNILGKSTRNVRAPPTPQSQ